MSTKMTRDHGLEGARGQGLGVPSLRPSTPGLRSQDPGLGTQAAPRSVRWLRASALVLLGLVIATAAPLLGGEARADMVARSGSYIVMTTDGGNEEVLVVIDERAETISVYKVVNQQNVQLFQRADLREIFTAARAKRHGRG
ncbi:MAG: hypothetical protein AMXMBFR77_24450 [Phycisphaerales bacterium]|nr:MAG: hypothetical protein BroJett004_24670 [Planctomycetota bacterium]